MRTLPVPTSPSKRFPTVYQAYYFSEPGMLARINGVITFRSDAGVITEHRLEDIRYFEVHEVVDALAQQRMEYDVAVWREGQAPTPTTAIAA